MRRPSPLPSRRVVLVALALSAPALAVASPPRRSPPVTSLHQLTARTLEGKELALSTWKGKVVLVVNTASECGFTPQYEGLEALWKRHGARGLVVAGFPSNDFGGQEPGSAAEIATFCKRRFGVTFPLFEKSTVKGAGASPIFRFLAAAKGEPAWNFHKYVVGKDGKVVAAFASQTAPDDPALRAAIDAALR